MSADRPRKGTLLAAASSEPGPTMSRGLRPGRRLRTIAWLVSAAAAALAAFAGLALAGTLATVGAGSVEAADLVTMDWPRWVHNLADLLQIATVVGAAVWAAARWGRRR